MVIEHITRAVWTTPSSILAVKDRERHKQVEKED